MNSTFLIRSAVLAVAYALVGIASSFVTTETYAPPGIWPSAGLALACILIGGYKYLPAIGVGALLTASLAYIFPIPIASADLTKYLVLTAVGAMLHASVGAYVIKRYVHFPSALQTSRTILTILILGGPVCAVLSAAAKTLAMMAISSPSNPLLVGLQYWVADVVGVFLVTPFILTWAAGNTIGQHRRFMVLVPTLCVLAFGLAELFFFEVVEGQGYSPNSQNLLIGNMLFVALFQVFMLITTGRAEAVSVLAKETSQQLSESQNQVDSLINTAVDGLITYDQDGKIGIFNPACERIFGLKSEDVIGKSIGDVIPGLEIHKMSPSLRHAKPGQSVNIFHHETEAQLDDGTLIPIDLSVSETRMKSGEQLFTGIIRNISVQKTIEKERENLIDNLMRSNEELGRFAYIASHDLKEPLRMITSFTSVLKSQVKDQVDDTALEYVQHIQDGGERMTDLVNGLLEYAKLEDTPDRDEDINLNEIIDIVQDNLAILIRDKKAEILYGKLPHVHTNPVLLTMIMQNLISNALKYQPDNQKPIVKIKAEPNETGWTISVADNGIGIPAEYIDSVFQHFRRLHRYEDIKGTGIGLSVVKKIVNKWGGKSIFNLRLMLAQPFLSLCPYGKIKDNKRILFPKPESHW